MSAQSTTPAAPTGPVLRDIHLPPSPSWWPPAPGWWMLAGLLLIALAMLAWWWYRRRRRLALERALLGELDRLVSERGAQPQQLVAGLHQLLRRAALRYDAGAAQRQGAAWRDTLARVGVDASTLDRLMTLEYAMYRPDAAIEIAPVVDAARRWLLQAWRQGGSTAVASKREPAHA
ncbi:DUF4381 family protein [Dyella sp. C9]|uniref:DUF4381 family protein n=1 Tax=Dyella sp. C9 TaxID=2202154 RepID=UPI000DEF8C53|nr:DUF4381 family protein [Dyella sp. C9]